MMADKQINSTLRPLSLSFEDIDIAEGPVSIMPEEIIRLIFEKAKTELPDLERVSKNWRRLVYSVHEELCRDIAFTSKDWKHYFGVDAGEAFPLSLSIHKTFAQGSYLLTWIPENIVTAEGEKKTLTADLVAKLAKHAENGCQIGYDPRAWMEAIEKQKASEKPHWVWLDREALGRGKCYDWQSDWVRNQGHGADVSGFIDTAVSLFAKYLKSNERCFVYDPKVNKEKTFIRTKDKMNDRLLCLSFASDGLQVCSYAHHPVSFVAVIVARKSFGPNQVFESSI